MTFDEAYPTRKMEETKKFLRDVWSGKEKTVYSAFRSEPAYRQLDDPVEMAHKAARNILLNAEVPGFNIPRILADFSTVSMPAYWGGERYKPVGGCVGIRPVIENAADVGKARPTDATGGDVKKAVRLWRTVSKELQTNRLPCSFIDIQGPLNTAAMLWKQDEFMMAMIYEPVTVHMLLEQVTEQLIRIIKAMIAEIGLMSGPLWPYIWLPTDIGVGIIEDYMPLISPKLYREFSIPYVQRISEAFGGVFIHCCGTYEHQLDNLAHSQINILGMEFHYPYVKPETIFQAFGSSTVIVPMLGPHGRAEFPDQADYILFLKRRRLSETRLWFLLSPEADSFNRQAEIVEGMM
ncbi:MAG: uroporphyrinogen decarboxylase family protein [Bacillota bacterium]|nr:uroporphyrinogen decarboxylase family protein [Bacillota bacterium]